MAVSVGQLIAWRDSLIECRLNGIQEIRDAFRSTVIYRGDAEIAKALAYANELIAAMSAGQPITTIRFTTSKGL